MSLSSQIIHIASRSGVARVSALHAKWARSSPEGALSVQCQELNALHSQCVDGANIKIPDKLATPPEQKEPFILDLLEETSNEFSTRFAESASRRTEILIVDQLEGERLLGQLLKSNQSALSEYELFNLAYRLATKYSINIRPYLAQIDMSALTTIEKHTITTTLSLSAVDYPHIWNSFFRSDILTPRDLYQRNLKHPFSLQRLYSSRINGLTTFFEFLRMATQDYTRKVLILQVGLEPITFDLRKQSCTNVHPRQILGLLLVSLCAGTYPGTKIQKSMRTWSFVRSCPIHSRWLLFDRARQVTDYTVATLDFSCIIKLQETPSSSYIGRLLCPDSNCR